MTVINAASSHQNSRSNHPNVVATDAANATEMAIAMRSIMPGFHGRISPIAPLRNGAPPYRKITSPSTGATHSEPGKSTAR